MLVAITRAVSEKLAELYPAVDVDLARRQHAAYCDLLRQQGARVRCLDFSVDHGDSCFIEDTAVVVDELAVLTTMGARHRREEPREVEPVLREYRPIERVADEAKIEGGDVLRIDHEIFVGRSARTDRAGVDELRRILAPRGYRVVEVEVRDGLHLKTAVTAIDAGTLLANREWVDIDALRRPAVIDVDAGEPLAANVLRIGQHVVMNAACPATVARVRARFSNVQALDISEFAKADGGLTCLSLIFAASE
jgi:dimethylargininase